MTRAEQLTEPVAEHGEGAVWWPDGHLRFVDMLAGDLLDLRDGGEITRSHVASVAAVVRPRLDGGAVVAAERGLLLLDEDGSVTALPEVWSDPSVRMNEGGCDPQGTFYCGSMAYDETPGRAAFYRFEADGSATVVVDSVTVSNGFAFSPDGSSAYYVDSPTHRIDVFDYAPETGLANRRKFAEIGAGDGVPDGITVDREGGVWAACWGGGAVRRFTADGSLDEVVQVPGATQVTSCALGGPALDRLYITTSRQHLDPARAGVAGALFVVDNVVPGMPVLPAHM